MLMGDYNTLLQLSVGLNVACIVAYKLSGFGKIVESQFTNIESEIEKRIEQIRVRMSTRKTTLENLESMDIRVLTEIQKVQKIDNAINQHLDRRKELLEKPIEQKHTPQCMGGLAMYCTLYAIIQLFVILFSNQWDPLKNTFYIYACISMIYIIIFCIIKFIYLYPLYIIIQNEKLTVKERRKLKIEEIDNTTNIFKRIYIKCKICILEQRFFNEIKQIKMGDNIENIRQKRRDNLEQIRLSICSHLGVKWSIYFSLLSIIISLLIAFLVSDIPESLLEVGKYICVFVPYLTFIIYIYIMSVYQKHRMSLVDNFFEYPEQQLSIRDQLYVEINGYLRINRLEVSNIDVED